MSSGTDGPANCSVLHIPCPTGCRCPPAPEAQLPSGIAGGGVAGSAQRKFHHGQTIVFPWACGLLLGFVNKVLLESNHLHDVFLNDWIAAEKVL